MQPYVEVQGKLQFGTAVGAGTVIRLGDETLIITAAHVVDGSFRQLEKEKYQTPFGPLFLPKVVNYPIWAGKVAEDRTIATKCDVVWLSPTVDQGGHDLALLRPRCTTGLHPAALCPRGTRLWEGEDCWYIGTPCCMHGRLEKSIVAARNFRTAMQTVTVTNGCGDCGSSGGGFFVRRDDRYVLAGVVTHKSDHSPKAAIFAQTPETLWDFLDAYAASKAPKNMPKAK